MHTDRFTPLDAATLLRWMQHDLPNKQLFGIDRELFFMPKPDDPFRMERYGKVLETPLGVAAGPHTQLAQNILSAWLCGARYIELKTVQVLDELNVAKPCIDMADEGYNCEWSQELKLDQSFEEYLKAFVLLYVLRDMLNLPVEAEPGKGPGFIFNMSAGYNLEGIKSPAVQRFLDRMENAEEDVKRIKAGLAPLYPAIEKMPIPARLSDNLTVSTMHGCPPDEIERIATYLITEKGVNTYIKCNPTLLGYDFARERLNELGFDYIAFDDTHFREDLQWVDAVPMFERLIGLCDERGLAFGVKLTNTFPVDVTRGELPSEEMYMSGRSLFPLTIELARRIARQFDGRLRISYSGGADARNVRELYAAGIWPITMATNVLKPGGYERFSQIADLLAGAERREDVDVDAVTELASRTASGKDYQKPIKPAKPHKIDAELPLMSCFTAPCRSGCPIQQDIPAYLSRVDEGKFAEALQIIVERNALPHITGNLCPHPCGAKCERGFYEPDGARIRGHKLDAARGGFDEVVAKLRAAGPGRGAAAADKNVAVIGGGPAGLATAFFLTRAGAKVTIIERTDKLGGVARHVIPEFRISHDDIDKDVALCLAFGAQVQMEREVTSVQQLLDEGFTDVVVATGAWAPGKVGLKMGEEIDVLEFLAAAKAGEPMELGTDVVIVGAGNTAMDAARVAKRAEGVKNVRIVYRRTKKEMPADEEELQLALEEGVELCELLAPIGVANDMLACEVMRLGEPDESGRRRPEPTGDTVDVPATAVICAVGEQIERGLYEGAGVEVDRRGRPAGTATGVDHVWAAGDCRRGPATFVEAIADAQAVARDLAGVDFNAYAEKNVRADKHDAIMARKGELCLDVAGCTTSRCLGCATVCEVCCDVCPNRANVAVKVPGLAQEQVVHVDGMCNECGNCAVFCPWSGRPYKDKLTLFWSAEDMDASENRGFLPVEGGFRVRLASGEGVFDVDDAACGLPEDVRLTIRAVRDDYGYLLAK